MKKISKGQLTQFKRDYETWNAKRKEISEKNESLIKEWRSIPWWAFWRHIPFEEQRRIIISNWESIPKDPVQKNSYFKHLL